MFCYCNICNSFTDTISDFGLPFEIPGAKKSSSFTPNEEALAMIMSMGFNRDQAIKALKATVSALK